MAPHQQDGPSQTSTAICLPASCARLTEAELSFCAQPTCLESCTLTAKIISLTI